MAVILKTPTTPRPMTHPLALLGYQVRLVPEAALLPALFGLYLLLGRPIGVALLTEGLIALFVVRSLLLWGAWRAWRAGMYRRGARLARAAQLLHPWSADAAAILGQIRLAQGRISAAVTAWTRAVALYPNRPQFLIGLGQAQAAAGSWAEARWAACEALKLDEGCSHGYALLAESIYHLNESSQSILEAVAIGLNHANDASSQALLYAIRAETAARIEHRGSARAALDQIQALLAGCPIPLQAELLYRMARVRRRLGEAAAAAQDLERLARLDPEGRWVAPAWRASHETALGRTAK